MHCAIAHHIPTDPTRLFFSVDQLWFWEPWIYTLDMVFCGVEYPFGHLGHMFWLGSLQVSIWISSLAEKKTRKPKSLT